METQQKQKVTLYILDKSEEFKGHCLNTMWEGEDEIHYNGGSWAERSAENPNLIRLTWDEFYEQYYAPYLEGLQGEWKEITEEEWDDALNCLPPLKWENIASGINKFFISEGYTAHLHSCYIRVGKGENAKYYSALRSVCDTNETLLQNIKNQLGI